MDVAGWLSELGLEQYAPAFRDNDVDGEVLLELTADDLIGLGVNSIGHRPQAARRDRQRGLRNQHLLLRRTALQIDANELTVKEGRGRIGEDGARQHGVSCTVHTHVDEID